jgi:uncharacterized lipoprotein YajG
MVHVKFARGANGYLLTSKKGDEIMKNIKILLGIFLMAFVLAGCASTGGTMHEGEPVKCPACGYEFNLPSEA